MIYIGTERRANKIKSVIKARQSSLKVVLENIHDPHNVSAIFRTCDAAGIPKVSLLYYLESFPKISKKSSASAFKWVEKERFKNVQDCYNHLREEGFKIYASQILDDAKYIYDMDFTNKVAIILGNEHRGISDEAARLADERFLIPMYGMVQSLNVSVSAAVIIYEALRQRRFKAMYETSTLSSKEIEELVTKWSNK
ncbi:MAG: RNA methyltransferase [Ignavibacteria bacterium]|nr:RNA methyltransferase [Ignavibacteria bacterium]